MRVSAWEMGGRSIQLGPPEFRLIIPNWQLATVRFLSLLSGEAGAFCYAGGEGNANMLLTLVILEALVLLALVALLVLRPKASVADARLAQLPEQLTRVDARAEALDQHVRAALAQLRGELAAEAQTTRDGNAVAALALRTEITQTVSTLGAALNSGLDSFRADNRTSAEALRAAVQQNLEALAQRLSGFIADSTRHQTHAQETLHTRLTDLSAANNGHQERLRSTVQERLDSLNAANTAKLEEMRQTVDEKLHATLQTRLTESFGQVATHLGEVQKGLGEMKELATGVGDLKKVLGNVKARGVVGEFLLGQQLEQMFSPEQYVKNARIKPNTTETVEFALKFPSGEGPGSYTLLPIDAKFPKDDWERLEHAYEHGTAEEIATAGKAFERAIRAEGKRICEKYIDPPTTFPQGIMFLPTEGLYAEVVRRPGLQSEIQTACRVTIAGPSTFMAILTSFQMGFHTLAIEKKGDEVWRVLSRTKGEFEKFGGLMEKVENQVGTVQKTLKEISGKTTTINRALKNVASLDTGMPVSNVLNFEGIAGVAPLLAAGTGEDD